MGGRWQKALDSAEERWLGPGSPAPAQLSGDEPEIALSAYSLVLFTASR